MIKLILIGLALVSPTLAAVALWGQCGGQDYTGDKVCQSGLVCVYVNQWYSQCQEKSSVTSVTTPSINTQPPVGGSGSFYVSNTKIYDANGKEFIMRGVNNAHGDWDNYGRSWALKSLPRIAAYKSNTVRILWRMGNNMNGLSLDHLENIIVTAKNNGLVSMIELHDGTGSTDPNIIKQSAQWFANNMALFLKYQRYVMINIVNEWSPYGTSGQQWSDAYKPGIDIIRRSGWKGVIVIDAPAYAQDPISVINYGPGLLNYDKTTHSNGNIVFSVHTYTQWKINGDYKFRDHLVRIQNAGLALIIGEFADKHPENPNCQWVNIDYLDLMKLCKERSIGYLGWSWAGNGFDCTDLSPLNLVAGNQQQESTWVQGILSPWGTKLFKTADVGIEATSVKASVFV